jgi:hypothetical protein
MTLLGILVGTGLGAVVGFGLGRLKSWMYQHEDHSNKVLVDGAVLKTRLRIKAIAVKGIVGNAKV